MRIDLLDVDLAELAALSLSPEQALRRGAAALAARPTYQRLRHREGSREALEELIHFYAHQAADLRLLRFSFVQKLPEHERSRSRRERVERDTAELRRRLVPALKARLRAVREEEEALERELRRRGIDPDRIGPRVPPAEAIDPRPMPWEGEPAPLPLLPPLPPRIPLRRRLASRLQRGRRRSSSPGPDAGPGRPGPPAPGRRRPSFLLAGRRAR